MNGYIQDCGSVKMRIELYTEVQMKILHKMSLLDEELCLFMDATGGLVSGYDASLDASKPYYYTVMIKNPVSGGALLPVAELVSTQNHTENVSSFLNGYMQKLVYIAFKKN